MSLNLEIEQPPYVVSYVVLFFIDVIDKVTHGLGLHKFLHIKPYTVYTKIQLKMSLSEGI